MVQKVLSISLYLETKNDILPKNKVIQKAYRCGKLFFIFTSNFTIGFERGIPLPYWHTLQMQVL